MPEIGEIRKATEVGRRQRFVNYIWWACEKCGKERWVLLCRGEPKFHICRHCVSPYLNNKGILRVGKESHNWKGGKYNKGGYFLIRVYPDDFFYPMAYQNGYVLVHRLVMAKYLNRCLLPWEIVHHINGVRDDNRIENLRMVSPDRHHQITLLSNRIHKLEDRVLMLEAENTLLETKLETMAVKYRYG